MTTERKQWVSWEELNYYLPGLTPFSTIDYSRIGGLTPGSIPFADADGLLDEDNANLFWDETNAFLGIHETTPTALVHINSVGGAIPALNLESGAEGEIVTPDAQQLRLGHWNAGTTTFTERLKFDAGGLFYVSYLVEHSVIFSGANGEIKQDVANFYWDNAAKRLGIGKVPATVLDVEGLGTDAGGVAGYTGVVARFHNTIAAKHTEISIDAHTNYDPVLDLAENGVSVWDIRNDASATDEFQIRYQVGGVNLTYLSMTNAGIINIINDLILTGTTAPFIRIESSDASDPKLCLKTTNTAHEVCFALDENAGADHVDFIGQTAAVDTFFHVIAKAGQTAKLGVQVAAFRGEFICGPAGHISLKNITTDLDLVLGIIDGGVAKTITWDADVDKLKHSHGLFDFDDDNIQTSGFIGLRSSAELRFYDNGNYVGFEAPALGADQIWVLPAADGNLADVLVTDGAGNLSWSPAGAGDVTAAAVITDHSIVRGNGGAKGVQDSGILIDDNDVMTFPDGGSISLQEDITFLGATTENQIKFPDNLADALSFKEGANFYMTFVTTDAAEAVHFHKDVGIGTAVPSCPLEVQGGNLYQGTIRVDTDNAAEYSSYGWMTNGVLKWSIYNHPTADKMIWADDGGVDLMTLTQTGQLGIGTVSPIAKLCINNSTSATSGFHISHTGASTTEGLNIYYDNAGVGTIYFDSIINSATALVKFRTRTAGAPIEAITLLGDGGVFMANLKSGANQGAAGAAANELWIDTADQTIKVGV